MGDFTIERNEVFYGEVEIYDPNGPEGMTIRAEPNDIVFGEPNMTIVAVDPDTNDVSRTYIFPFEYSSSIGGKKTFEIISVDTEGITVTQELIFRVKGNAPHFFTGVRQLKESFGPVAWTTGKNLITWTIHWTDEKIYNQQMRIGDTGRLEKQIYSVQRAN